MKRMKEERKRKKKKEKETSWKIFYFEV